MRLNLLNNLAKIKMLILASWMVGILLIEGFLIAEMSPPDNYYRPPQSSIPPEKANPPDANAQNTHEIINLIEGQFSSINRKKYDDAYNFYTAAPFRNATSNEVFRYFIESYPGFNQNKNLYFGIPTFKPPALAIVPINLISMQGEFLKVEYYVLHENNQWKILGIKVFPPPSVPKEVPKAKKPELLPKAELIEKKAAEKKTGNVQAKPKAEKLQKPV